MRSLCRVLPVALVLGLSAAGCSNGSGSSSGALTTHPATSSPSATSPTSPRPTSAATSPTPSSPAASPSGPEVLAGCVLLSEYKHVVHYKAGEDTVEALELGSGTVGVVLAHQSDQDLCAWEPYAHALAKKGYRVLDLSFGDELVADVVGAVAELRAKGSTEVALVGASMGGTTVVAAAATIKPPVTAVIDLSGPLSYNDADAIDAAPALTMPALFVVSKDDEDFVDAVRATYKAATRSPGRKLLVRNSYEHGIDMVQGSTQAAIEAFLAAHT